jgi:hypothetical protein
MVELTMDPDLLVLAELNRIKTLVERTERLYHFVSNQLEAKRGIEVANFTVGPFSFGTCRKYQRGEFLIGEHENPS